MGNYVSLTYWPIVFFEAKVANFASEIRGSLFCLNQGPVSFSELDLAHVPASLHRLERVSLSAQSLMPSPRRPLRISRSVPSVRR